MCVFTEKRIFAKEKKNEMTTLTLNIDGEKWAHEVLLPIVQEVREATVKGYRYPDAHDLLKELEELDEQEA